MQCNINTKYGRVWLLYQICVLLLCILVHWNILTGIAQLHYIALEYIGRDCTVANAHWRDLHCIALVHHCCIALVNPPADRLWHIEGPVQCNCAFECTLVLSWEHHLQLVQSNPVELSWVQPLPTCLRNLHQPLSLQKLHRLLKVSKLRAISPMSKLCAIFPKSKLRAIFPNVKT